jgi:hypothetical protein
MDKESKVIASRLSSGETKGDIKAGALKDVNVYIAKNQA